MVAQTDRHRRDLSFAVGDKVWLSTRYLPVKGTARKLSALWAGPFVILFRVGNVAYRLQLPTDWQVHDVFHVSQLKGSVGNVTGESGIDIEGNVEYEIERILQSRIVRGQKESLVKWLGYNDFENSWVKSRDMGNAQQLVQQFEQNDFLPRQSRTRRGGGVRPVPP